MGRRWNSPGAGRGCRRNLEADAGTRFLAPKLCGRRGRRDMGHRLWPILYRPGLGKRVGRGDRIPPQSFAGEEFGGLTHPHSPRRIYGEWWVCNLLDGTLRQWDARSSHWRSRVQLSGYPRGMASAEGTLYVGESQARGQPIERARLAII